MSAFNISRRSSLAMLAASLMPGNAVFAQAIAAKNSEVTDAATPSGIRMVHLQIPNEKEQAFAFFWNDRHALHSLDKLGLLNLAPIVMIRSGAGSLDGGAMNEELKDLGVSMNFARSARNVQGAIFAPAGKIREGATILKAFLNEPRISAKHLDQARRDRLTAITASLSKPADIASLAFYAMLIGSNNPLLHYDTNENPSIYNDVTREDIEAWVKQSLARDNLVVVATGPFSRDEAGSVVEDVFSSLPQNAKDWPETPLVTRKLRKTIVVEQAVEQSLLLSGQPTNWTDNNERWERAIALDVLGEGERSRLFVALRDKLGATYGTNAGAYAFHGYLPTQFFRMSSYVANDKVIPALETMRQEYARFISEGVKPDEVEPMKTKMLSQLGAIPNYTTAAAGVMRMGLMRGEPSDLFTRYPAEVANLSAERINQLIRTHLSDELVTIIVTPSAEGLNADCVIKSYAEIGKCEVVTQ